jgi:hypothetical protein
MDRAEQADDTRRNEHTNDSSERIPVDPQGSAPVERQTERQMPSTKSPVGPAVLIIVGIAALFAPGLLLLLGLGNFIGGEGIAVAVCWGVWGIIVALAIGMVWRTSQRSS